MNKSSKTHEAVDKGIVQRQGTGFRRHLGASIIGRECARQIWYMFRWARRSNFPARVLRLFDRGQKEEARIVKWLRQCGIHVLDEDPATQKQFRIEDHDGHFGGSLDGKIFDAPDYPGIWVLGEFKTHNDKSFKDVVKNGVEKAKPEHFVQVQIYMRYEQLPACLYFAVNKNDDDIYVPHIEYDPTVAEKYIERAHKIIYAEFPPERISDSPGWWLCKFCDFQRICHYGEPKEKNCRTCINSKPIDNGRWLCRRYDYVLNEREQKLGCLSHQEIPES